MLELEDFSRHTLSTPRFAAAIGSVRGACWSLDLALRVGVRFAAR